MSTQLQEWQGQFGCDYTDRNVVDWRTRVDGFRKILDGLDVRTILEIGCNRGHNLSALERLGYVPLGVEPNDYAREIASRSHPMVTPGDIYRTHSLDAWWDLVFTSGVLIHVPSDRLDDAISEMIRVSRRYVLAIEYHADEDIEVPYRGMDGMLWARDYAKHLEAHGLTLVRSGVLGTEFDNARFVLASKLKSG